ncbi:unnamed protein product [Leptidea sinapis]|uniref:Uncharacterized protein n=1 Tax=Leptidea sinapis TaxID=189913 RepID=A0A5E4PY32_9NEOP|nr:unnamed protein product [Leptidea sinapis]
MKNDLALRIHLNFYLIYSPEIGAIIEAMVDLNLEENSIAVAAAAVDLAVVEVGANLVAEDLETKKNLLVAKI